MTDLSPEASELFARARSSFSPDEERLAKVGAALAAQVGGGLAAGAVASAASGSGKAGVVSAFVWPSAVKLVGVSLVMAGAAGGVVALRARSASPEPSLGERAMGVGRAPSLRPELELPPPTSSRPLLPEEARSLEEIPEVRVASHAPAGSVVPRPSASVPLVTKVILEEREEPAPFVARPNAGNAATSVDDSLPAEIALLRDARAAMASGAAGKALHLLEQHAADYPRGTMVQERLATRVFALCMLGRIGEARSAAAALERAFPRSPHLERVRASCARTSAPGN